MVQHIWRYQKASEAHLLQSEGRRFFNIDILPFLLGVLGVQIDDASWGSVAQCLYASFDIVQNSIGASIAPSELTEVAPLERK